MLLVMGQVGSLIDALGQLDMASWAGLLWLGPLSTGIGYWIWLRALAQGASVAVLSTTLYVQPLVGATVAMTLGGEAPGVGQAVGGALILASVALVMGQRSGNSA